MPALQTRLDYSYSVRRLEFWEGLDIVPSARSIVYIKHTPFSLSAWHCRAHVVSVVAMVGF